MPCSLKQLAIGRSEVGIIAKIFSKGTSVDSIASKVVCGCIDSDSNTIQYFNFGDGFFRHIEVGFQDIYFQVQVKQRIV